MADTISPKIFFKNTSRKHGCYQGAISQKLLGGKLAYTGIICTEKGAPKL